MQGVTHNRERETAMAESISSTSSACVSQTRLKASPYRPKHAVYNNDSIVSPSSKASVKSAPPDNSSSEKKRRSSPALNKHKYFSAEKVAVAAGSQKQKGRDMATPKNRSLVEQFARPRRPRTIAEAVDVRRRKDGRDKPDQNDNSVNDLKSQVSELRAELDNARRLNMELQSQNKKLSEDLAVAQAKIAVLTAYEQKTNLVVKYQNPNFEDIRKLIANKLEPPKIKKDVKSEAINTKESLPVPLVRPTCIGLDVERKAGTSPSAPPPPPPPPNRLPARATNSGKPSAVAQLYQSLSRQEGKTHSLQANYNRRNFSCVHSSIIGEIQNRSALHLAVKSDIETKRELIHGLIQKVLAASYTDIEDLLKFVGWLDNELSSLVDEQAVLKHFKWPEKKADAMREAAIEYRNLKLFVAEISTYKDDPNIQYDVALKKMGGLLDKSEKSIERLEKLRNAVMLSYQHHKIPTNWMLESGIIISKIKQVSMGIAKMCANRIMMELESIRYLERESTSEALLLQGVRFAYRAHQIAGELDSETLCAFEELQQRLPGHKGISTPINWHSIIMS